MEKRTVIALVLTIVLLFVFQMYFSPGSQETKKETPKVEAPKGTEAPKGGVPEKQTGVPAAAEVKASRHFVVDTPLIKVKISDLGGGISSVELKRYKETVDRPANKELVEDVKPYTFLPTVSRGTADDRTLFTADRQTIEVKDKPETITLSGTLTDGTRVKKIYTFHPDRYVVDARIETDPAAAARTTVDFAMISATNPSSYTFKGPFTFNGKSFQQIEKLDKTVDLGSEYKYAGLDEGFFAMIWIPAEGTKPSLSILKGKNDIPLMRLATDQQAVAGRLFFGPKKSDILKTLDVKAEKIVDFGWFDIIAKPMVAGLNLSNRVTRNYGIDIILLTILIKIIFYPLSVKSYKSMKEMQKMQPQVLKLKEKYKDDRAKLNQEMMEMYKRKGVNPMGGCLPMVIQIPVFFALYKALSGAIEMRHAPFFLWINDLSAPEDLFSFTVAGYTLPIRILPLVMGITQVIQQKMTPTSADPMQEKMMLFMPIFFTFLFWGFPSGLVLYWLVNNVISIAQQYYINKKV